MKVDDESEIKGRRIVKGKAASSTVKKARTGQS